MIILQCLKLFYTFFKIGMVGFGGGYAMLSMIMTESLKYAVTIEQLADLNALDLLVPGPIAINAATYVGFLDSGFWGALAATIGVTIPSFIYVSLFAHLVARYQDSPLLKGFLAGVRPAAVGLIGVATVTIASGVLLTPGMSVSTLLSDPLGTLSLTAVAIFVAAAVANIRFKVSPILLVLLAGVVGAIFIV